MCCRQVAIAKMVQFLGARRASLRDAVCHELCVSIAALLTQFLFTIIAWFLLLISPIWAGNHEEQGQGKLFCKLSSNSINNCSDINSTIKPRCSILSLIY